VPTDTVSVQTDAVKFALRGVAWTFALFGLLRLNWTEVHAVLPLTRAQAAAAVGMFGPSTLPVQVTLACSGTDAIALCLGAVLAYPAGWRMRLAGAAVGAGLILCLNTARIGTLGLAASAPALFDALHIYLWPAVLTIAIAGYVFGWMRLADRPHAWHEQGVARDPSPIERPPSTLAPRLAPPSSLATARRALQPTRRFVVLTVAFLLLFTAASPLYLQSAGILALAGFIARAAAGILAVVGVGAYAVSNVLWTSRGSFLVTQECVSTPLIPVYLAAVCAHSTTWRRLILGVIAAAPLFVALGIVRLLVVALPDAVTTSPLFMVHAFYQLLLGAVLVFLAAQWRHGGRSAPGHALLGVLVGVLFVEFLGPFYTRLVTYPAGVPGDDPQGAIAFLPAFQVGLYLALWVAAFVAVGWRRFLTGLALLQVTQTAVLLALHALASPSGLTAHVSDVRGWAVAGPLLIVAAVVNGARPRR
jgi:exosortase/archaeosortase family protein